MNVPAGEVGQARAGCPTGTQVIAGGFFVSIANIGGSQGYGALNEWFIIVANTTSIPVTIRATAICAAP